MRRQAAARRSNSERSDTPSIRDGERCSSWEEKSQSDDMVPCSGESLGEGGTGVWKRQEATKRMELVVITGASWLEWLNWPQNRWALPLPFLTNTSAIFYDFEEEEVFKFLNVTVISSSSSVISVLMLRAVLPWPGYVEEPSLSELPCDPLPRE